MDMAAVREHAQRAPNRKSLGKIHRWPPAALALRKRAARQHRVIGAHPTTQRHLHCHQQSRQRDPHAQRGRQRRTGTLLGHLAMAHGLCAQQRQQYHATQQVQGDDGWKQFHGDCERAKSALQTDP